MGRRRGRPPAAGLAAPADGALAQDLFVVPEIEVVVEGLAAGVVCRDIGTARLYWMDASDASWVREVPAGDLLPNLRTAGRMPVRLREDGSLSVVARATVSHQLRWLELGQSLRVVLGAMSPRPTPDGRWHYLARLEMPPVLLSFVAPDAELPPGTSRLTEIDSLDRNGQPRVVTVDVNSRLVTLDLPAWLPAAHQAIIAGGSSDIGLQRFDDYSRWYREGLSDRKPPENPAEAIVRLAGDLLDGDIDVDPQRIVEGAGQWMASHGHAAFNLVSDEELDVAPVLAAALAFDALSGTGDLWAPATVLLLHQIGRRAAASLHTEQLATGWVGRRDRHGLGGAWLRLRALTLSPSAGALATCVT